MPFVPRLMLITDQARTSLRVPDLAQRAIAGGVDVVQLREPAMSHTERRAVALAIIDRLASPNQLVVNNDLTLAAQLGCGLHLPERSNQPDAARARLGVSALIGRSVHSPTSAAASAGVNYLIAGHVFATTSKPGQSPIGLAGLAAIVAATPLPVLAIGGITAERIADVIGAGACGIAIMSAIVEAADPRAAAACLRRNLDNSLKERAPMTSADTAVSTISLTVNGKSLSVPSGSSISDLLQQRQLDQRLVAVEHNRAIVPFTDFPSTLLAAGDEVEIVHFVAGG